MYWYHTEEEHQVGAVERYHGDHPRARYLVEFADGECYLCAYDMSFESENGCDLDIEPDDPRYDEFYQAVLRILETVKDGSRRYNEWLSIDYRDFPASIKDADTGTVVYPAGQPQ